MTTAPHATAQSPQTASPPNAGTGRWKYHATILTIAMAVVLAAVALEVSDAPGVQAPIIGRLPGTCSWKRMFAMDCPGCGLTRCFVTLAQGEVRRAWNFNPAGLLLFGVVLYQLPFRTVQLWRLRQGMRDYRHGMVTIYIVIWCVVGALLLQWIWRVIL